MNNFENAAALCAVGAEKAVSNELRKSGFKIIESLYGKVRFKADTEGLYRALIGLRAADRVLLEITCFKADNFDALFEGAATAEWERVVPKNLGLKIVKVRSNRSQLKAETSIQSVVHKAAAQRLCDKYKINRLPEDETAEVRVYIEKDTVFLLLDLSGVPLFKRGYRSEGGIAPLRETTAASMILLSGWKRKFPLYDPFCGSGTILTEAAMYAWDIAPGLGRRFALEKLSFADNRLEENVREDFRSRIDFSRLVRIAGSDEDVRSVSIASSNIARLLDIAGGKNPQHGIRRQSEKSQLINLKTIPAREACPSIFPNHDSSGYIITNPPYGKRLGSPEQAEQTYREMSTLGRHFTGWQLVLITDHEGFESFYGKKADSCCPVSNGAIPSYIFLYDGI
jgi:putative N6-adenine-specific DNA methylase